MLEAAFVWGIAKMMPLIWVQSAFLLSVSGDDWQYWLDPGPLWVFCRTEVRQGFYYSLDGLANAMFDVLLSHFKDFCEHKQWLWTWEMNLACYQPIILAKLMSGQMMIQKEMNDIVDWQINLDMIEKGLLGCRSFEWTWLLLHCSLEWTWQLLHCTVEWPLHVLCVSRRIILGWSFNQCPAHA